MSDISHEELEKLLEKAKRDYEELVAKMTPEERAAADERARKAIAEDEVERQRLIEGAAALKNDNMPKKPEAPKTCPNCGAQAKGENYCPYCGTPLMR